MATDKKKQIVKVDNLIQDTELEEFEKQKFEIPEKKIQDHTHNGSDASKIRLENIRGFFEIVSVAPTHIPRNAFEQIKLYVNGATYRIYFYDYKAKAWRYA